MKAENIELLLADKDSLSGDKHGEGVIKAVTSHCRYVPVRQRAEWLKRVAGDDSYESLCEGMVGSGGDIVPVEDAVKETVSIVVQKATEQETALKDESKIITGEDVNIKCNGPVFLKNYKDCRIVITLEAASSVVKISDCLGCSIKIENGTVSQLRITKTTDCGFNLDSMTRSIAIDHCHSLVFRSTHTPVPKVMDFTPKPKPSGGNYRIINSD